MKLEVFVNLIDEKKRLFSLRSDTKIRKTSIELPEKSDVDRSDFHTKFSKRSLDERKQEALIVRDQNTRRLDELENRGPYLHEMPDSLTRKLPRPNMGFEAMMKDINLNPKNFLEAHMALDRDQAVNLLSSSQE